MTRRSTIFRPVFEVCLCLTSLLPSHGAGRLVQALLPRRGVGRRIFVLGGLWVSSKHNWRRSLHGDTMSDIARYSSKTGSSEDGLEQSIARAATHIWEDLATSYISIARQTMFTMASGAP